MDNINITYNDYLMISNNEDKLTYLKSSLKLKNTKNKAVVVYGKVARKKNNCLFVTPYDADGKQRNIFLDNSKWGIPAPIPKDFNSSINENDYIKGNLTLNEIGPYLKITEKMDDFEEFRDKLLSYLRKKWEKEGFVINDSDIAEYDGKIAFDEWFSDKVVAMLEKKYERFLQGKMEEQEKKLHNLQNEVSAIQTEINTLMESRQKEQDMLNSLQEEKKELEKQYLHYKDLGIISDNINTELNDKTEYPNEFKQLVEDVWGYLWKKNLYYEKSTVTYFMNALRTQQLTVLWGKPGTGKTSLPRAVAEAIQAKCICVQVQSNWTDNQDLLGFYNVVDKRYVSTQFLDSLIEAAKHPEQMYIILLDEMNLSNIEYYFSEMLNVFTWDEAYTLHLYSKRLRERAQKDLKDAEEQGKETSELTAVLTDMNIYKPEFTIPENVRFVGTLNTDATTKTISPKVVDRSCLIELQTISYEKKEEEKKFLPEQITLDGNKLMVSANKFKIKKSPSKQSQEFKEIIEQIRKTLDKAGISVSNRVDLYIDQWTGWSDDNCVEIDEIVLEKILPLIDIDNNEENKEIIKNLKDKILEDCNCEKSLIKIEKMEKQAKKNYNRIMYWEN